MRKLPWSVISVVSAASVLTMMFVGCGSEESPAITDTDSGASSSGGSSGVSGASSGTTSSGGSSGTSSGDAAPDSDLPDGATCATAGAACTAATASICCSKVCNANGTCAITVPDGGGTTCIAAGQACTSGPQCCTGSCIGNVCSATGCKMDSPTAEACNANEECCSGKCGASGTGTCQPLGGGSSCRIEGNACANNAECCSNQCAGGKCVNVSFCQQPNDVCANDFECCGGTCIKQGADVNGRCGLLAGSNCSPMGIVCTGAGCDNKCCSNTCGPYGTTGVNVCQPPSGCRPQDELCAKSEDCCGGPGQLTGQKPGQGDEFNDPIECKIPQGESLGRCEGAQCLRPGTICKPATGGWCGGTSNNCCESLLPDGGPTPNGVCNSNNEACCSKDALGIPRCRGVNFVCGDAGAVPAGQICTTSADCCGKPCVNGKCEGTCVPKGGECTVSADCCAPEPCVFPAGSTKGICGGVIQPDGGVEPPVDSGTPPPPVDGGTCALYGQTCTMSSDCCSGVPCSGGFCRYN